ncbi:MAG TPA: TetR/AcrR family transcriptional regulator [Candidatus Limnocylindria bacterium]|nr:TetR/AcrR family transcriptional regulator [Candidatus Limnocylindria bacterium]
MPEPRRDELVLAAYREIAENGFEGLRTREVAGAVGVNVATLHYYFPTKEDLIKAVVGHAMSRFQSTLAAEGTAIERLRGHFAGLRRLARNEPELFATMAELMLRAPRDRALAPVIEKTNVYWHDTLRGLLRAAREDGDLPKAIDPDGMAAVIVATLKGAYLLPGRTGGAEEIGKVLRQLEELLGTRRRA